MTWSKPLLPGCCHSALGRAQTSLLWPRLELSARAEISPRLGPVHAAAGVITCLVVARGTCARGRRPLSCCRAKPWDSRDAQPRWRTDEELEDLVKRLEMPAKPARLPDLRGMPPPGFPGGPTAEEMEAIIDDMVPAPSRYRRGQFDPHKDDPLTKGIDVMLMPQNQLEQLICCRGCGIPLQTHDPNNVGYVRFARYVQKWSEKLHRKIMCTRCLELERGLLKPVVRETLGSADVARSLEAGLGGHVVPAAALQKQLRIIKQRRCLVVYILDVLDLNGSFIRNLREIVGRNPIIVVGTKIDLLPPKTDLDQVHAWLRHALIKKKCRALDVRLVSSFTGKGISATTNALLQARQGMDVFVVGAANAGKSMFITRLLEQLEQRFPDGRVEDCESPIVSATPGTTLGTIPLRAFRRSATSPVFSCLYDTPGVHQPTSMQNLIPIDAYNMVQPTRQFGVHTVRPAKDVLAVLRDSGAALTAASTQAWLGRPVRYLWGFPGEAPVAAVEVVPPVSPMVQLSFVGVANLSVICESITDVGEPGQAGVPAPPENLVLTQICYIKTPEELPLDGAVLADVSLAGLGWVAVTVSPVSAVAAGRSIQHAKIALRVYGPRRLKVKIGAYPMPVAGLPGVVPRPPEVIDEEEEQEDADVGGDEQDRIENARVPDEAPAASKAHVQKNSEESGDSTKRRRPRLAVMPDEDGPPESTDGDGTLASFLGGALDTSFLDDSLPDDDLPDDAKPRDGYSYRSLLGGKLPVDQFPYQGSSTFSGVSDAYAADTRRHPQKRLQKNGARRPRGSSSSTEDRARTQEVRSTTGKGQATSPVIGSAEATQAEQTDSPQPSAPQPQQQSAPRPALPQGGQLVGRGAGPNIGLVRRIRQ